MASKRPIFQDIDAPSAPQTATTGLIAAPARGGRALRVWLWALFALVALMIAVGGMTRLTDSGLSITEWRPLTGAIPPLNAADWQAEFEKYQAIPEFQLQNHQMTLEEFQHIYWWEWGHRQFGRVIGLVWALGLAGFALAGAVPRGWMGRFLALGALGGAQGAIGWWMVSSGLTGAMVDVASYRLATHLGLAFVILGLIAQYSLDLARGDVALIAARRAGDGRLVRWSSALLALAFVQVLLGALVAGIDAGRGFPTWPDMNGQFFPADAFYVPGGGALWHAFFENPGLVQFMHRMTGYALAALALAVWAMGRTSPYLATRRAFHAMIGGVAVQIALGIYTVLTAAAVHVAIAHQAMAVILWVLIIHARHQAGAPVAGTLRRAL